MIPFFSQLKDEAINCPREYNAVNDKIIHYKQKEDVRSAPSQAASSSKAINHFRKEGEPHFYIFLIIAMANYNSMPYIWVVIESISPKFVFIRNTIHNF